MALQQVRALESLEPKPRSQRFPVMEFTVLRVLFRTNRRQTGQSPALPPVIVIFLLRHQKSMIRLNKLGRKPLAEPLAFSAHTGPTPLSGGQWAMKKAGLPSGTSQVKAVKSSPRQRYLVAASCARMAAGSSICHHLGTVLFSCHLFPKKDLTQLLSLMICPLPCHS